MTPNPPRKYNITSAEYNTISNGLHHAKIEMLTKGLDYHLVNVALLSLYRIRRRIQEGATDGTKSHDTDVRNNVLDKLTQLIDDAKEYDGQKRELFHYTGLHDMIDELKKDIPQEQHQ